MALRLEGGRSGPVWVALAPLLLAGGRVYCVDGGNQFNPYRLTELLRARGVDPMPALERIFISRAYTCHQLLGAVEALARVAAAIPARAADAPDAGALPAEGPASVAGVILGVETLFLDEDLPLYERARLYERALAEARRLRGLGLPMLITHSADAAGPWGRELAAQTRPLGDAGQWVRRIERAAHK